MDEKLWGKYRSVRVKFAEEGREPMSKFTRKTEGRDPPCFNHQSLSSFPYIFCESCSELHLKVMGSNPEFAPFSSKYNTYNGFLASHGLKPVRSYHLAFIILLIIFSHPWLSDHLKSSPCAMQCKFVRLHDCNRSHHAFQMISEFSLSYVV